MRYYFPYFQLRTGDNLRIIIETDVAGPPQFLEKKYVRSMSIPRATLEEFLGEMRLGEVSFELFNGDNIFQTIFGAATEATLFIGLNDEMLFFGSVDFDTFSNRQKSKVVSCTAFSVLRKLKSISVSELHGLIPLTAIIASTRAFGNINQTVFSMRSLFEGIGSLLGCASFLGETLSTVEAPDNSFSTSVLDCYLTDSFFSHDLDVCPWSFYRHSTVAELLAELQKSLFAFSWVDAEAGSPNLRFRLRERFNTNLPTIAPVGRRKSDIETSRRMSGVSVSTIFGIFDLEKTFNFDDSTLQGWTDISLGGGGSVTNPVGAMNLSGPYVDDSTPQNYVAAAEFRLEGKFATKIDIDFDFEYLGTFTRGDDVSFVLELLDEFLQVAASSKINAGTRGAEGSTTDVQHHTFTFAPSPGQNVTRFRIRFSVTDYTGHRLSAGVDNFIYKFNGTPKLQYHDYAIGSFDENAVQIDTPFLADSMEWIEYTVADAGRFLYYLRDGQYHAAEIFDDGFNARRPYFGMFLAEKYWRYFGGSRALIERVHHGLRSTDDGGVTQSINVLGPMSDVAIDSDRNGEVIDIGYAAKENELQFTLIERRRNEI